MVCTINIDRLENLPLSFSYLIAFFQVQCNLLKKVASALESTETVVTNHLVELLVLLAPPAGEETV